MSKELEEDVKKYKDLYHSTKFVLELLQEHHVDSYKYLTKLMYENKALKDQLGDNQ